MTVHGNDHGKDETQRVSVCVVMFHEWDDVRVIGVFTDDSAAQDFIDAYRPKRDARCLTIEEWDVSGRSASEGEADA